MKNLMRALRDVIIAGVIVLAGIGLTPQEVWAANSTSIDSSKSATVGDTGVTVTATFELESGYEFRHSYDNPTSAISNVDPSVSGNTLTFKFDAATAGTATVTVWIVDDTAPDTPVDGTEKTCTITVSAATPKTITLSQTTMSLYKGSSDGLTATPDYAGYDLEWSTSNGSVATVSGSGTGISVLAMGVGSCNITVKDKNNPSVTASCAVTVTNLSGTAIVLDKTTAKGTVSDSFDIIASATPAASVVDITFVSSNTDIVDDGTPGAITGGSCTATFNALGAGEATITATAEFSDGSTKTATCKVTINPAINDVYILEGSFDSVAAGYKSVNYTPVLDIDPGSGSTSLTEKDITWSTSDATKATVTKNADGTICVNGLKKTTTDVAIKATIAGQTFTVGTIAVEQPATGFKTTTNAAEMNNLTTIVYDILPADSDATYVEFECTSAPTGVDKSSVISGDDFEGPAVGTYTIKATVDNSGIATYGTAGTVKNYSTTFTIKVTTPATEFTLANPVYVTNGFSRSVSQFVTLTPLGSAITTSTISSGDTSKLTTNGTSTITGKAVGDTTVTVDVNGLGAVTGNAKVLEKPSIEYKDKKLEIEQPSGVYTDKSSTITNVTRGVIKVYYDGSCLWTSDKKEDYADDKEISAEKIQSIIKEDKVYDKLKDLDKDKATLQFRVYGADKNNYNDQAYGEDDVDVYRITVSGTGVNTTKYYGVKGANISLTATAAPGYQSAKFKDSDSSTKSVSVDGSATYTATAEKSGSSTSKGAGADSANGANGANGANSKYDKVPKTGEAGDVWAMWVVFLACIVAAGAVFVVRIKPEILMKGKDNKK